MTDATELDEAAIRARHQAMPARGGSEDIAVLLAVLDEARAEVEQLTEERDAGRRAGQAPSFAAFVERTGRGALARVEAAESALAAERRTALSEAAEALRQAERDGYLFLDETHERIPWEVVARWLDDRAALATPRPPRGASPMTEPTCRACYVSTLSDAERERFYAEPVTSCVYFCDDHQRAMDNVLANLPQVQLIKAHALGFEFGPTTTDEGDDRG